jgi:uncharacterized protein (TIGR02594 family)
MLPNAYAWLQKEGSPKMLVEALKLYGIMETAGVESTKEILQWAKEVDLSRVYNNDALPWCGLLLAVVAKRAGKPVPKHPLWALSWQKFGTRVTDAMLGDVLVFKRHGGGHVGLYVGEDDTCYHVLGGNQSDMVKVTRIEKSRLYSIQRPPYNNQPSNIRKIFVEPTGTISINER